MHAIGLVQLHVSSDIGEEKRDEDELVFFRERRIHGGEGPGVFLAVVGRHLHAGEDDFRGGMARMDAVDDALEIGLGHGRIDAAQAVGRAQREHEQVDGLAQDPLAAAQAAGRRLAAEAGVDDAPGQFRRGDFFLDERGVGLARGVIEPVAGRQAVAEEDDGVRFVRADRNRRAGEGEKENQG